MHACTHARTLIKDFISFLLPSFSPELYFSLSAHFDPNFITAPRRALACTPVPVTECTWLLDADKPSSHYYSCHAGEGGGEWSISQTQQKQCAAHLSGFCSKAGILRLWITQARRFHLNWNLMNCYKRFLFSFRVYSIGHHFLLVNLGSETL